MAVTRVAILADFAEERWPSMDLMAEMLQKHLSLDYSSSIEATLVRPSFVAIAGRLPNRIAAERAHNADRIFNRFVRYPLWARTHRKNFDLFHVTDHSYSQLVHQLPADRTIVTCHDLDTFRCILEPPTEARSRPFRAMARYILRGLQRAARVICPSVQTQQALMLNRLVAADRLGVVPNGVHPAFSAPITSNASAKSDELLGKPEAGTLEVLHVGSTIPRKRIDVLLQTFAGLTDEFPTARLVRVGGGLTSEQQQLARELHLEGRIVELPFVERDVLAAIYRRAAVVLVPSEAEGFGLPIIEAMAGGRTVVASDLHAFRQVLQDGQAGRLVAVQDSAALAEGLIAVLENDPLAKRYVAAGVEAVRRYDWSVVASQIMRVYETVAAAGSKVQVAS